ncbi:unnamed protein product [Cercospora beticola]|nr:unnamed protein product [Cercospora beticola]
MCELHQASLRCLARGLDQLGREATARARRSIPDRTSSGMLEARQEGQVNAMEAEALICRGTREEQCKRQRTAARDEAGTHVREANASLSSVHQFCNFAH